MREVTSCRSGLGRQGPGMEARSAHLVLNCDSQHTAALVRDGNRCQVTRPLRDGARGEAWTAASLK